MSQGLLSFPAERQPIVFSNGYGLNSFAALIALQRQGIIPDLIIHSDVGSEKQDTKDYIPLFERWLADHGMPATVVVRYQPKKFKHWPPYRTLYENLLTNISYPSITYGMHSCSIKWKIAAINAYVKTWQPALDCWARGQRVIKMIGYDAGTRDTRRCATFQAKENPEDDLIYEFRHPLQELGWARPRCEEEVIAEGYPVTPKSSCFFCLSMQPHEVRKLTAGELQRIVILEARAQWRQTKVQGLWRTAVKGCRGATRKPGSMTQFIREEGLLPEEEIKRLIAATSKDFLHKGDIADWPTWIESITEPYSCTRTALAPAPIPAPSPTTKSLLLSGGRNIAELSASLLST